MLLPQGSNQGSFQPQGTPVNFGLLQAQQAQPQGPQTQVVSAPQPQGGEGTPDLKGIGGLLSGIFGSNLVQHASDAVSGVMGSMDPKTLGESLLPRNPNAQGFQPGGNQALDNSQMNFKQYQQKLQQNQQPSGPQNPGQQGILQPNQKLASNQSQQGNPQTLQLIKQFEGFSNKPYWDVNAYRAGYGSDTTTLPDGSIQKIKPGMYVSEADAERDLYRRTSEFQAHASTQVGQEKWQSLSPNAQAALTSVTYNYGSLPKTVVRAVESGDNQQIAEAVRNLDHHNGGINRGRRHKEADLILQTQ